MIDYFPKQSLSISMMISENAYRAVVGVERVVRLVAGMFRSGNAGTRNKRFQR